MHESSHCSLLILLDPSCLSPFCSDQFSLLLHMILNRQQSSYISIDNVMHIHLISSLIVFVSFSWFTSWFLFVFLIIRRRSLLHHYLSNMQLMKGRDWYKFDFLFDLWFSFVICSRHLFSPLTKTSEWRQESESGERKQEMKWNE